jgi:rod shape-determining protein MreC
VRAENRELKQQIEQMRIEQVRLSEDAAQARRLQSLLAFKEQTIAKTVPAQVIGSSGSDLSQSIYIDKGSSDGIAQDMAVITVGGIVGKVLRVYPTTSLVLMINDQSSGVGALLEKSRLQGVLRGSPNGELILDRVMGDEKVSPGDVLLSSGGDQIFPKGLPVGTVTKVSPGKELFLNIKVKPAADLSRLEEVLVVAEKQEHEPVAENRGGGRVRAADILAQRLPSVPDKPPTAAAGPAGAVAASNPTGQKSADNSKPDATGSAKPLDANATKPAANIPTATKPGSPSAGTVRNPIPATVQPVSGEGVKKAEHKPVSDDSYTQAAAAGTSNSNPGNLTAKQIKLQPKPSSTHSTPLPPASDDNPH